MVRSLLAQTRQHAMNNCLTGFEPVPMQSRVHPLQLDLLRPG